MINSEFKLEPSFRASLYRYLSQDIVDALPERRAYNKATRHLNTLRVALSSYLPKYIADDESHLTVEYSDLRPGTFMFADVSGFTALSERLQGATSEGAEIMTQIINDFFSTMLEILAKSDGQMLKFAGDALLTFFPVVQEDTEEAELHVAAKAIRTGLRMQRSMQERFQPIKHKLLDRHFGSDHDIELKMSIGIARGKLFEALVGNATQRDHMIMGDLPGMADRAEEAGVRDDVIITADLADALNDEFTLVDAPAGEGFYQVVDDLGENLGDFELDGMVARRRTSLSGLLDFAGDVDQVEELRNLMTRVDNYARFVANEVVSRLAIEGDRVEPQNRPAVVIFAYFKGIADMLEAWSEKELPLITSILNRYYSGIQQTIAAYGGALTRSDPYKVGSKLLVTFGAPIAHPDDPFRAVATGMGMLQWTARFNQTIHDELPEHLQLDTYLEMRMGIALGLAYAGEVGWKQRREYTVMGDDVNLAARLMGKSNMGDIWISERVHNRVERFFMLEALPPMQMKGKSAPTHAFRVQGWEPSVGEVPRTSNTRFVGRDATLLTLQFSLEQARARRRRVIALVGETGLGKTRLATQLLAAAEEKDFNVAWSTCLTMDYARITWATIIGQLLRIPADLPLDEQYAAFVEELEHYSLDIFHDELSLLLFGFVVTDANTTDQKIDPRLKDEGEILAATMEEIQIVIAEVLKGFADERPTLIVLDDLHKANPYAVSILQYVIGHIKRGRLIIIVTYEREGEIDLDVNPTILEHLSEDEAFRVACDILKAPELGPGLRKQLWTKTSGRPLFVESLLQSWQEHGAINITNGIAELREDTNFRHIPDQLLTLLISSIDRLSVPEQTVMQAAAVIALEQPTFNRDILTYVATVKGDASMDDMIEDLLVQQLLHEGDDDLRIQYGVLQQAVYESLSRMQRQKLHSRAADFYKRHEDAGLYFTEILRHMVNGGRLMRALEMVEKAATEAEAVGDYETAMAFYEEALQMIPNDRSLQTAISRMMQKAASIAVQSTDINQGTATGKVTTSQITAVVRTMIEELPDFDSDTDDDPDEGASSSPDDEWMSMLKKKSRRTSRRKRS